MNTRSAQPRRSAVTLVELVLSMTVMTVLIGGLGSAMVLAGRAVPDGQSPTSALLEGYRVAEEIAGELYVARTFTERTATAIEFTVADRGDEPDGDEVIRFEWSGTPGDPLIRQYNGGTAAELLPKVYEFDLTYTSRSTTETTTQTVSSEGVEALLATFDGWSGVTGTPKSHLLGPGYIESEYFEITPEAGANELKITGAEVVAALMSTPPDAVQVEIRRSTQDGSYEPAATPIGTPATIPGSALGMAALWHRADFSDVIVSDPDRTDYCLVVTLVGSTPCFTNYYYSKSAPDDGMYYLWSDDGGASWDPRANARNQQDLRFKVYGSFATTSTEEVVVTRNFVSGVRIKLRTQSAESTRVETSVQVLNSPEVPIS